MRGRKSTCRVSVLTVCRVFTCSLSPYGYHFSHSRTPDTLTGKQRPATLVHICHTIGWCHHDWPIRNERGSGLSESSGKAWWQAGMRLWLPSGGLWVALGYRWVGNGWMGGGGCTPGREVHTGMEACNLGGDLSNLHICFHLLSLLVLFMYLDLPANAWSFIVEKTKMKK